MSFQEFLSLVGFSGQKAMTMHNMTGGTDRPAIEWYKALQKAYPNTPCPGLLSMVELDKAKEAPKQTIEESPVDVEAPKKKPAK